MRARRRIYSLLLLVVMISALYTAAVSTTGVQAMDNYKTHLDNVRDYTAGWSAAASATSPSYAIDGGYLFAGGPTGWRELALPEGVIGGAVAVDPYQSTTIYLGAANELALYVSRNSGTAWQRIPLDNGYIGGVTDIAVNGAQRTLYVGTDTAGIYRLRDVGSSIIAGGHTMVQEPIVEIVADQLGAGMVFARTQWTVYRGLNNGQQWLPLDNLHSTPTALAIANTIPATAYIGTTDRGLLQSTDGTNWNVVTDLLPVEPGMRLQVSAIAVDPVQPTVVYAALNSLLGSTTLHQSPIGVALTSDQGGAWTMMATPGDAPVVELLPVAGATGAVYALTTQSRTPLALGDTTSLVASMAPAPVRTTASASLSQPLWSITLMAYLIAAAAAAALMWLFLQEWQQPTLATAQIGARSRFS